MPAKAKPAPVESSPEAINENLGKRVKKLRGDRGWSLEELANVSGVSRSMLSEIEREKANPTLTVTFRIARAFGRSASRRSAPSGADAGVHEYDVRPARQVGIGQLGPQRPAPSFRRSQVSSFGS